MSDNLKADALLEEITLLHSRNADLRVQMHNLTLQNRELEQRVQQEKDAAED